MAIRGELTSVWQEPAFSDPTFLAVCGVSALVGFGISFTSLWFLGQTTVSGDWGASVGDEVHAWKHALSVVLLQLRVLLIIPIKFNTSRWWVHFVNARKHPLAGKCLRLRLRPR